MCFWRIAALLLAAMVVPTAAAEMGIQLDLDTATLDELIVARDAISARIEEIESEMAGEVLPAGAERKRQMPLMRGQILPHLTPGEGKTGNFPKSAKFYRHPRNFMVSYTLV